MKLILEGVTLNDLLERISQVVEKSIQQVAGTPKQTKEKTDLITRSEVARLLKISLPTLNDWTKSGFLQSYRIGSRVLYKLEEVEQALIKVPNFKHKKGGYHEA